VVENQFQDLQERDEVDKILAELDLLHPARAAFLRGAGTLDISLLVQRADVRKRLEVAYHAALERYLKASRRDT
jgi:hypothetical protein